MSWPRCGNKFFENDKYCSTCGGNLLGLNQACHEPTQRHSALKDSPSDGTADVSGPPGSRRSSPEFSHMASQSRDLIFDGRRAATGDQQLHQRPIQHATFLEEQPEYDPEVPIITEHKTRKATFRKFNLSQVFEDAESRLDEILADVKPVISDGAGRIEGLDGLRGVAVLSVLAFHFWPSAIPGGFLGVDVFFVISGYLITTLLLREKSKTGRIKLWGFWTRRARRLLPALVLVVTSSVAVAWLVNADLLVNVKRQVLGALTFSTNWVEIVAGTDYFADSARSLFATFWSLAVEEQFYVLWPILLIGLIALTASSAKRMVIALCAAAASAVLMAALYDPQWATRVYYGTDTHSFGLTIGVALAFAFSGKPITSQWWHRLRPWVGFSAFVGLIILNFVIESDAPSTYRDGILTASVLSAAIVAALPGKQTLFTRFCQLPALAWIGERSYGIYLWHWPILLIVGAALPTTLETPTSALATVLVAISITFAVSEASYRWIEAPIRHNGFRATWAAMRDAFRPRSRVFGLPGVATACAAITFTVAVVGFVTAPEKSQAQLSVEAGQRAIAAQNVGSTTPPAVESLTIASNASQKESVKSGLNPSDPKDPGIIAGDDIVGLGDSVMSGAAPALYARFPGIYINARPILQWHDAPAMVQQMIDKGIMRRVVILNFGTNAGFKEPESEKALREILDKLGPQRRVVLVNTVGVSYWVPSTNARLLAISSEYPNAIVADWYSMAQEKPGLLHRDRTHPNDSGSVVYATVIADALANMGPG